MKHIFLLAVLLPLLTNAQKSGGLEIKNLAVPNAPIFMLTEAAPSLIENPATPKAFVLGIAQSFANSPGAIPQDYSAEFTPYWWLENRNKSVFNLLGTRTKRNQKQEAKQNPFAGLRFTSVSLGFLNKDLIPDNSDEPHLTVAAGFRSGIVRIQQKAAFTAIAEQVNSWHKKAQQVLSNDAFMTQLALENDTAKRREMLLQQQEALAALNNDTLLKITGNIERLIATPPLFTWDIAGAHATYGIGDSSWQKGRSAIWSSWGTNLSLGKWQEGKIPTYLNLSAAVRYLTDHYALKESSGLGMRQFWDFGGRIGITFDGLSVQYEYFRRSNTASLSPNHRSVGIINIRITPTIYINGAFGKGFNEERRLIALLGIRWGLGNSLVPLPGLLK